MHAHAQPEFRSATSGLIRAVAQAPSHLPAWPDLTDLSAGGAASMVRWLRDLWADEDIAEALEHSSPALARQVRSLLAADGPSARDVRRAALSVARYLRRWAGRPTPFGLLAGVTALSFEEAAHVRWGPRHHAVARPGAEWLARVIARLESCPELLLRLPAVANSTAFVRGDRLVVPYALKPDQRETGAVEVSLRYTGPVKVAVEAARSPIPLRELAARLQAGFPPAEEAKITALLTDLVSRRVLITSLHAPSTEPDALAHLMRELETVDTSALASVAELVDALREIRADLEEHNREPVTEGRKARGAVAARMREIARTDQHPLAVDLRLDATVSLPPDVAHEAARAARGLARIAAYPYGTPAWRDYHQRFYERFGLGALVPLLDVVADSGIGYPDGYPGTITPERRSPLSDRDRTLLRIAQTAVLEGQDEVVLDEQVIRELELGDDPPRLPPHLELGVRIHADDTSALARGDFRLEVVAVSRAAGVLTGRFLSVLEPPAEARLTNGLASVSANDDETVAAQLSFTPLDPATAHVARSPQVLPVVISLGEHRRPGRRVLTPADLAVGCDGRRMYLAAPTLGYRLEAVSMHALNLRTHTPPLARFLIELSRAQCAQTTAFDWGTAEHLPFLPRVRYGRAVLSPAQWRLHARDLPEPATPRAQWEAALTSWRKLRRAPEHVHLVEGDRRLPLDLAQPGHRTLLRAHLDRTSEAILTEAPDSASLGWCGGRPHEVVVPMSATEPPRWPRLPAPTPARVVGRDQGQLPGASQVLLASLYGDLRRQDLILADRLPDLLGRFDWLRGWWFIRFRDPDQHLRLRLHLPPGPAAFGDAAAMVSTWVGELRKDGLLREVRLSTSHPETGRWGSGAALTAAEEVFGADSRAVLAQLGTRVRPGRRALVAANTVSIAAAWSGGVAAGMRWLIEHIPPAPPGKVARPEFAEAVRLADPRGDWAALRAALSGGAIVDAWKPRDAALTAYRAHLPGPATSGIHPEDVLSSLLHVHFVRAVAVDFPEEAICLYLARAAALAWTARNSQGDS